MHQKSPPHAPESPIKITRCQTAAVSLYGNLKTSFFSGIGATIGSVSLAIIGGNNHFLTDIALNVFGANFCYVCFLLFILTFNRDMSKSFDERYNKAKQMYLQRRHFYNDTPFPQHRYKDINDANTMITGISLFASYLMPINGFFGIMLGGAPILMLLEKATGDNSYTDPDNVSSLFTSAFYSGLAGFVSINTCALVGVLAAKIMNCLKPPTIRTLINGIQHRS